MGDDNYNTIEILKAVEEIMKEKIISEKKQKDYENLIKSFSLLPSELNAKLIILGEGLLRESLSQLIEQLNLNHRVDLHGFVHNPYPWYRTADLFVLSSDHEGLLTVLIEALACKAQIVSTNVSGVEEVIGNYGKIVEVRHPKALSEAIVEKLKDNSKNELGFKHVKSIFDIDVISNEWLNIYNEI